MKKHKTNTHARLLSGNTQRFKGIAGYTLIELMIAMVLGLFLMVGVFQLNASNKKTSRLQDSLTETQKNGRFSIDTISYAIKTAGYSGFYLDLSSGVENILNTPTDVSWDVSKPLSGYNNVNNADTYGGVTGFVQGTDVLLLKGMSQKSVPVLSHAAQDTLVVATDNAFAAGDILVVSDLDQASVFQVSTAAIAGSQTTLGIVTGGATPGNMANLANNYNVQAEVGKLETRMFYIKNGLNGRPSLFKTTLFNNSGVAQLQEIELASNISNLQVVYSLDTNGDKVIDAKQNAASIVDWNQVIGATIALLVESNNDNVMPEKTSFSFDEAQATFTRDATASATADRRLKRVFRAYIPLRNRVL